MTLFEQKLTQYAARFARDLSITAEHVGGMFGNFHVETGGFKHMQELNPTVAGSRGGYGWPQWTGPRRRAYEAWCTQTGRKLEDEETMYLYIIHELKYGDEQAALRYLKMTTTAKAAAETFCAKYERPGVPHMAKRIKYAEQALKYIQDNNLITKTEPKKAETATAGGIILGGAAAAAATSVEYWPYILIGGFFAMVIGLTLVRYIKLKKEQKNANVA